MRKVLLSNKGVTLIELILATVMLTTIVAAGWAFYFFGNKSFSNVNSQTSLQSYVRVAANNISQELRYADSVQVISSLTNYTFASQKKYIYVGSNGNIIRKVGGVDSDFVTTPTNSTCALLFSASTTNLINITVTYSSAGRSYSVNPNIQVLNIGTLGIQGTSGAAIYYTGESSLTPGPTLSATTTPIPAATNTPTNSPTPILVTGVTVTSAGNVTSVKNGSTLQMSVTIVPSNATDTTVTWTITSGASNATINSTTGLLTGTKKGSVTVIATANDGSGKSDTKSITVN